MNTVTRIAAHLVAAGLSWTLIVPIAEKPWDLSAPTPAAGGKTTVLDRLDEVSCQECHAEVVAEWASTSHALAWVDELYQEQLEGRRKPEACHGCHIPQLLHGDSFGKRPRPRAEDPHLGVSCESCHLHPDGTLLGPRGTATDAHATRASETMIGTGSNALCAACHSTNIGPVVGLAKDFARSNAAAEGASCVGCHMRPRPIEGTESEGQPGIMGRSHALQTPRDPSFLRRAFGLSVRPGSERTVVALQNRAGHRVPGLLGRDLEFTAEVLDANGAVLGTAELRLTTRAHLPVDEALDLVIEARGHSVRVRAVHHDPLSGTAIPFLDELLETPAD